MIKKIKSMTNVKALSKNEIRAIRGGGGSCREIGHCPDGFCCYLVDWMCYRGSCPTP